MEESQPHSPSGAGEKQSSTSPASPQQDNKHLKNSSELDGTASPSRSPASRSPGGDEGGGEDEKKSGVSETKEGSEGAAPFALGLRLSSLIRADDEDEDGTIFERENEDDDNAEDDILDTLRVKLTQYTSDLKLVFECYCSYGDFLNVTSLSFANFKKLAHDIKFITQQRDAAEVDLIFTKSTSGKAHAGAERLQFSEFLAAIARMIVFKVPDVSADSANDVISTFMNKFMKRARRLEAPEAAEQLLLPNVVKIFKREDDMLQRVST